MQVVILLLPVLKAIFAQIEVYTCVEIFISMVLLHALNSGMIAILKALFADLWTCSSNIKRGQAISGALLTRHVAGRERVYDHTW